MMRPRLQARCPEPGVVPLEKRRDTLGMQLQEVIHFSEFLSRLELPMRIQGEMSGMLLGYLGSEGRHVAWNHLTEVKTLHPGPEEALGLP